jgi:glycosyltransferase involved in cell wall biosynthesis
MPETLPRAQAFYLRAATRLSARRASALIAVSAFTAAELQDVLAVPAERIHVVPNGLDDSFRRPDEGAVAAYRERRGLPAGFVLAVGTLQPRKNLAVLLAAVAELAQRGPMRPPDLVVAGAPGWGDIDIAAEARRLGLEGTVRVTGYVEPSELPLLYASAAVFAFPSRYEGFGLPAVEAMACGTPVIAARASSLPEVCGDAAVLVDPGVPAAWADALGRLLSSPGERQRLAAAGIARAAGFSWDKAAAGTLEAYRHALDGARVPLASGPCRSAGAARRASQACPEDQDG